MDLILEQFKVKPEVVSQVRRAIFAAEDIGHRLGLKGKAKKAIVEKIVEELHLLNDAAERIIVSALIDFLVFVIFNADRLLDGDRRSMAGTVAALPEEKRR